MAVEPVARVVGIWRYLVKSMAAEPLEAVDVSWHGLAGDRRWAFVRAGMERSGFPWLTIRERPRMRDYRPALVDPARPDKSRAACTRRPERCSTSSTRRSRPSSATACA